MFSLRCSLSLFLPWLMFVWILSWGVVKKIWFCYPRILLIFLFFGFKLVAIKPKENANVCNGKIKDILVG